ncbi:MAG TPA: nuclear transport factor 2 family protein [Mucilaginibacter sp.]|jgi:ketosteroid isomerase-like protein|nr:nuclear transport factor 2 family protein [Mucilaginibacter sp.]
MAKHFRLLPALSLLTAILFVKILPANAHEIRCERFEKFRAKAYSVADTIPPSEIMDVVTATINAINSFDIAAVADLYTPNAVVTDDEAPYSWNGPTAGVQWVNAVEKVCKNNRLTKLKGVIEPINVYQQSADNCYIVVPVSFTGTLPGRQRFSVRGAFTFVLRQVNGKWLIKSQGWLQQKAINGR